MDIKFNKIVEKFLSELHNILPEEKDIVIFKSQVSVVTMIDPNKLLRSINDIFHNFVNK